MVTIEMDDSAAEAFINFAKAHHDGDINDAIRGLLFCHKVLTARMMRGAKNDELK